MPVPGLKIIVKIEKTKTDTHIYTLMCIHLPGLVHLSSHAVGFQYKSKSSLQNELKQYIKLSSVLYNYNYAGILYTMKSLKLFVILIHTWKLNPQPLMYTHYLNS